MTEHDPPESADTIEEAAATWLVRLDRESSPEEWARLDEWMAANSRHRAAFLRLSVAWRQLNGLRKLAPLGGGEPDIDLLDPARLTPALAHAAPVRGSGEPARGRSESHRSHMSDVRAHRARSGERQPAPRWSIRSSRIAASLGALALVGAVTFAGLYALKEPASDTYTTKVGELRRIVLQDGSLLTLNTDSVAQVSYTSGHRKVQLVRGEALFTVAHQANRPFDVMASSLVVRAVGTQFSVRVRDESSVDVLLTEGRLALNTPSSPTLSAGWLARLRSGQVTTVQLSPSDITDALGWSAVTTPHLTFHGETLASVAAEMNRYNLVKIVVPDPVVAQRRIGGKYPALEPEGFASHIAPALGVRARLLDGGAVISLEAPPP